MVDDTEKHNMINIKKASCDENIVYIIGAGFSAFAGLPVMSNFLTKSKEIYFEDTTKYDYFRELFNKFNGMAKIKNYFSANMFNIEEILSILEMDVAIGNGEADFRDKFINYIKDVISYYSFEKGNFRFYTDKELGSLADKPFSTNNNVINYYGYFVASLLQLKLYDDRISRSLKVDYLSSKNNYSVISFNYDMIIEQIKNHITSFTREQEDRIFDIYKLHGSIDEKDIIPPTWAKSISSDMKETWKDASKKLQNATQIRIIGYSLPITDSYFRFFLKSALLRNDRLKKIDIICYDPNGSVRNNYSDFIDSQFPGYRFMNKKVDDYFYELKSETIKKSYNGSAICFNQLEEAHEKFMNSKSIEE